MNFKLKLAYLFTIINLFCVFAQDNPPAIMASGSQGYCPDVPLNIVTSVSITDPDSGDNSLDSITIQISEGYSQGQDLLTLTGTHPSITAIWSPSEGALSLTGPASFLAFENAIQNVQFQTSQTNFTEDKFFSINIGSANYLPSTGHYYLYVSDLGITWTQAASNAASQTFFGLQGYLATIITPEESQLAGEQSPGAGWIGATDTQNEGTWRWVTGPEAGTIFWVGDFNGNPQNGAFSFWNDDEPNNFNGNEDYAHITDPSIGQIGSWNDLPIGGDGGPSNPYYPKGYLVEFGGMPGDPMINLSASTSILMPRITVANDVTFCESESIPITVNSNTDTVLWFDSATSTTPVFNGFTYSPTLTTTTNYWLTPVFSGCSSGEKTQITVTVNPQPTANNITVVECEDDFIFDGVTTFNLNGEFSNIVGSTTDLSITFFSDVSLTSTVNADSFNNTANPQTLYTLVTNTITGCTNTSTIILEVGTEVLNNAIISGCDTSENQGFAEFDLLEASNQILLGFPQGVNLSFYETLEDVSLETNPLDTQFTNTTPLSQIIYVTGSLNNSCYGVSELELLVVNAPEVLPDSLIYYCLNQFPNTISLSSGLVGNQSNYVFNWTTGETSESIDVNAIGVYTVTITSNLTNCSVTRTITVLPSNIATVDDITIQDNSQNNTILITVTGEGEYEYALDNSNGPYQDNGFFTNVSVGIHTVYIQDVLNNCGITAQEVSVIGYPKYFTPNGDNINERWNIKGLSNNFNSFFKVNIYNRFGKLLYVIKNKDDAWDGTYKGVKVPSSDYWFTVSLAKGKSFSGHFTLKR